MYVFHLYFDISSLITFNHSSLTKAIPPQVPRTPLGPRAAQNSAGQRSGAVRSLPDKISPPCCVSTHMKQLVWIEVLICVVLCVIGLQRDQEEPGMDAYLCNFTE